MDNQDTVADHSFFEAVVNIEHWLFQMGQVGRFFNLCVPSLLICRISSAQTAGLFASQVPTPVLICRRVSLVENF